MHSSAHVFGELFFERYWRPEFKRVLDIGSYDVNGSLRDVQPAGSEWVGIDIAAGPGVDVVLTDPYSYPFPDGHFDAIVSTSCFEHDNMFWLTFLEALRVLSPGGMLYLNSPSQGGYHGHPGDNWRFYPDSGLALQQWAHRNNVNVRLVESFIVQVPCWYDFVAIFTKGDRKFDDAPLIADRSAAHISDVRIPARVVG